MARGRHVEHAPHVAVVPVWIDAERAVGIGPAVLAPESIVRAAEFVAARVEHGHDPDLGLAQPAGDWGVVGFVDELLREKEGNLDRKPFPGVMAAHKETPGFRSPIRTPRI